MRVRFRIYNRSDIKLGGAVRFFYNRGKAIAFTIFIFKHDLNLLIGLNT